MRDIPPKTETFVKRRVVSKNFKKAHRIKNPRDGLRGFYLKTQGVD